MPTFSETVTISAPLAANGANTLAGATTVSGALTTTGTVDLSGSTVTLPAAGITPVRLASGYRTVASDVVPTLAATDRTILLLESASGAKAGVMTATHAGHVITIRLVARSGGSYTFAVTGGAVTLDAANEAAMIVYDGSAWQLLALMGATLV